MVDRYEFHAHRIPGSTLFRVPEVPGALLCWQDDEAPEESFKARVEAVPNSGVTFEKLWDSVHGGITRNHRFG